MDVDVAEAISLANLCEIYNKLPRAGGVLDQDSYHIWLIEQVASARQEKHELDEARNKTKSKAVRH